MATCYGAVLTYSWGHIPLALWALFRAVFGFKAVG